MHKLLLFVVLLLVLILLSTRSYYTEDSKTDMGSEYKNAVIQNKSTEEIKQLTEKIPLEKLKKMDNQDFKNHVQQTMYENNMPKPLYTVSGTSSSR